MSASVRSPPWCSYAAIRSSLCPPFLGRWWVKTEYGGFRDERQLPPQPYFNMSIAGSSPSNVSLDACRRRRVTPKLFLTLAGRKREPEPLADEPSDAQRV